MVRHMVNPDDAIEQLNANKSAGMSPHENTTLSDTQINDLLSFLKHFETLV